MKKFSFALDKVLSYKEQFENSLRNEHAAILQEVHKQEDKIAGLEAEDVETRQEMGQQKQSGCTILEIRTYENYLKHLRRQIELEKEKLFVLRKREEKKREELIAAKTETASLDKLKEKKQKEYQKAEQKEQEQLIEEFVNHELTVTPTR